MVKSLYVLASTLFAGSVLAATNCTEEVNKGVLALVDNSTYLNTCSPGSTWKLTSLFEAANLTQADFLTFCNATACMNPMHEVLDNLPECESTYQGKPIVFVDAISTLHDACHKLLNKAGVHDADDDEDDHDHAAANATGSAGAAKTPASVPTPTPSSSATAISSKTLVAAIAAVASGAAFVL